MDTETFRRGGLHTDLINAQARDSGDPGTHLGTVGTDLRRLGNNCAVDVINDGALGAQKLDGMSQEQR